MTSFIPSPRSSSRLFALVPCAGAGVRAGAAGPKQYAHLAGSSIVVHTLRALSAVQRLQATLVVLSPQDDQFESHAVGFAGWVARVGGASRAESVANGLSELIERGADAHDWVLVHDAARCLVRAEWIDRLIDACEGDEVGGLLALPLADTLKQGTDGRVASTIARTAKWQAQTPQMFRIGELQTALAQAGGEVTDESSAIEATGRTPKLVRGDIENFKITYPGDFAFAERCLRTREC